MSTRLIRASVSEHTSKASDIKRTLSIGYFSSYILKMISETQFPHPIVRTLSHNISNEMREISNQIADTNDLIARDELLSRLMLLQASLALMTLASLGEDQFFLQRAYDLLHSH